MRSIKPTTIRLDDEDIKLVEIIQKKYGQSSLIGALRTALRIAAGEENRQIANGIANKGATGEEEGKPL